MEKAANALLSLGGLIVEGIHLFVPLILTPVIYEIRLQPKTVASNTGNRDMQTVYIALRILHRPIEEFLPSILQYDEKILPSIANEVLKARVAQYDADQLIKQRERISQKVKEELTERAKDFNIVLDDVAITHLGFMKEYASAIEQKQIAQQYAERQRFIVMRDEEEKNARVILSKGEAEAAQLINNAVSKFRTDKNNIIYKLKLKQKDQKQLNILQKQYSNWRRCIQFIESKN